jgi:hypothetical protein
VGPPVEQPSDRVVEQRVRNRLIEYFELASSFSEQREYEAADPIVHVPYEVIEQWADWGPHLDLYLETSEVYTAEEVKALKRFQLVWDKASEAVPDDYPSLQQVQAMPAWEELRREAESALGIFAGRGKLPEDHEVP